MDGCYANRAEQRRRAVLALEAVLVVPALTTFMFDCGMDQNKLQLRINISFVVPSKSMHVCRINLLQLDGRHARSKALLARNAVACRSSIRIRNQRSSESIAC